MNDADSIDTTDVRGACAWCQGGLERHHYVQVVGSSLTTLCSDECLREKLRDDAVHRARRRRRTLARLVVAVSFVGACITPHDLPPSRRAHAALIARAPAPSPTAPLPGAYGPEWPPSEASLLDELGHDAWFHPLAGPFRRMPIRDSRVFGAERAGDRPIECRKGHCGVDLGGEIWGEQVHAAHDGVVDRVRRDPNELHGGHYVRLAHHNGTVFTQYFHLAAIARWVQPGVHVKAGDVIGLVGDTGVKASTAHLHFTVSVKPGNDWVEEYVDPEPLIALWPLRIPLAGSPIALISATGPPGVPIGGAPVGNAPSLATPRHVALKHKHPHARPAVAATPKHDDDAASLPAPPADDEDPAAEGSE